MAALKAGTGSGRGTQKLHGMPEGKGSRWSCQRGACFEPCSLLLALPPICCLQVGVSESCLSRYPDQGC